MRRPTRRRFIVFLALLSHLMTALFVHVPMAYATMVTGTAQPAASQAPPPCPDHMSMHRESDVASAGVAAHSATSALGTSATDHESGCKSGPCKCPCAHAQALAFVPMTAPMLVAHSPSVSPYRMPPAPDCATSFFRPPI